MMNEAWIVLGTFTMGTSLALLIRVLHMARLGVVLDGKVRELDYQLQATTVNSIAHGEQHRSK